MFEKIKEASPIAFDVIRNSLEFGAVGSSVGGLLYQNVTGVFSGAILGFGCGAIYNAAMNIQKESLFINCLTNPMFRYSAALVAKEYLPNSTLGHIISFAIITASSVGVGIYTTQRADIKLDLEEITRIATASAIIHTVAATLPSIIKQLPRLRH